jgi:hypothetical protein
MEYVVMNPNGEHLSVGYMEFKDLMNYTKKAWLAQAVMWVLTKIYAFRYPIKTTHLLLFLNSVVWTVYSWIEHEYWMDYSENGIPNEDLFYAFTALRYFSEALFFTILEMVTNGYEVTSKRLRRGGKRYSFIIFLLIGSLNVF